MSTEGKDADLERDDGTVAAWQRLVACGMGREGRKGPSDEAPSEWHLGSILKDADAKFPLTGSVGGNTKALSTRAIQRASYTSVYLKMRDGVRIAADVWVPDGSAGKRGVPVVFHQARYNRGMRMRKPINWWLKARNRMLRYTPSIDPIAGGGKLGFLSAGFAVVSVDVRGTGASGGVYSRPWQPAEREDSIEILDWIVQQPFCNGDVCLWGISYDANAAWFTSATGHPAIKAVAPLYMFFDIYEDIAFPGGCPHHKFVADWELLNDALDTGRFSRINWRLGIAVKGSAPVVSPRKEKAELRDNQRNHAANWTPGKDLHNINFRDDFAPVAQTTPDLLSPYHGVRDIAAVSSHVPMLFVSGFFDATCEGNISAFLATTSRGMRARLILGPWNHSGVQHVRLGEHQRSRISRFDLIRESIRFFDATTRLTSVPQEMSQDLEEDDPDAYSMIGAGVFYYCSGQVLERCGWKTTSSTWPPPSRKFVDLFLAPSSRLSPDRVVSAADTCDDDIIEVCSDHSFSGTSRWEAMTKVDSLLVYRLIQKRGTNRSHLRYTTDALVQDVEVTGNPVLTICCGSSIGCFDVFCYILEVSSSGHASYVTEGCFRSRHRSTATDSRSSSILQSYVPIERKDCLHAFTSKTQSPDLSPSDRCVLKFHLRAMSYCFAKGSRIQILIAGADSKHFLSPPNAGKRWEIAVRSSESKLMLPIVEHEGAVTAAGLFHE